VPNNKDVIRAACPVCRGRWFKDTTVGFVIRKNATAYFFAQQRGERPDIRPNPSTVAGVGGVVTDEGDEGESQSVGSFSPAVWRGSSGRSGFELLREQRPIRCRYGHLLEVPAPTALDRAVRRTPEGEPMYLRSSR
jgi:hypothetical protein